jgi:DNA invertase Pin-like site-specific DNA recombinase
METLKFAPLVRISTEKQEQQGQSLETQHNDLEADVQALGGEIYKWYEGQEHATPAFERKKLEELMVDARQGKFDAIIIWHSDRWSRDNDKSSAYLEELKALKIRFFVRQQEYDLYDPSAFMFLSLNVVIGQYHAAEQARKSLLNRINRARKGYPATTLPYGRIWDEKTTSWRIDPEKQPLVQEMAKLCLSGYCWRDLGKKYGLNPTNLCHTVTRKCGEDWVQHFKSKKLNIDEEVITKIPRLLPESTIKLIKRKCKDRRTWDVKTQRGNICSPG